MIDAFDSFLAAHEAAEDELGVGLFTISIVTADGSQVTRAYSSHEDVYPVGGLKPAGLVDPHAGPLLHPDRAAIEQGFAEKDLIISLGGTAAINVPLLEDDRMIGAVNFFGEEGRFTQTSVVQAVAITERLRELILAFRANAL